MVQRTFSRTIVNIDITIETEDKIFRGVMENISMGGLYANTGRRIAINGNDRAEITIPLPAGMRRESLTVPGMVTRINEQGVAFKYLETDVETLRILFYLVHRSAADR